jgi:hypothetical protein
MVMSVSMVLPQVNEIEEEVEYVFLSVGFRRGDSFFKKEFQVLYPVFEAFELYLAFSGKKGRWYLFCFDVSVGEHLYFYFL